MRKPPKMKLPEVKPAPYTPFPAYASGQESVSMSLGPIRQTSPVEETRANTQKRQLLGAVA